MMSTLESELEFIFDEQGMQRRSNVLWLLRVTFCSSLHHNASNVVLHTMMCPLGRLEVSHKDHTVQMPIEIATQNL